MIIKVLGTSAETSKPSKPFLGKYHPSILIKSKTGTILVDVGNDILKKLNTKEILEVGSILLTHGHRDAIQGLPILNKVLYENDKFINVYANHSVISLIKTRWHGKSISNYNFKTITSKKTYEIEGLNVYPLKVFHDRKYPTYAYNLEKVFLYMSDGGPLFDEYKLEYFKNNIIAIFDGAYWDHQVGLNHIAVLKNIKTILGFNNKYTFFTGMGNQWIELDKANDLLNRIKNKLQEQGLTKVKEVRTLKEGEKFKLDLNKALPINDDLILKPGFDKILSDPTILQRISKKELLMVHLRCHQLWGIKKTDKILKVHVLVVKEMFKRGLNHNVVNDLDKRTYEILGREVKIFDIWNNIENEIIVRSDVVKFVGSTLEKADPNDLDIITHPSLNKLLRKFFDKYSPHFLGSTVSHGNFVSVYDLVLRKKSKLEILSISKVDLDKNYKLSKINKTLNNKADMYIIEPYIEGVPKIKVDKEQRLIYECVITKENKEVVTDFLAYKSNNFFKECLYNRIVFMYKKWLDKKDKKVLLPIRWYVKKENLVSFLKLISKRYKKLIIRPAMSLYYDGKFVLNMEKHKCQCLNCGYVIETTRHCIKLSCPRCNGPMRRLERPGIGKSSNFVTCKSCGFKFDYTKQPEVVLGAVECPKCLNWIDQTGQLIKKVLKPIKIFPPLKATGSSYHELEYFKAEDAWQYFGKFGVEKDGAVRFELKIDGYRCINQYDGEKIFIYFEDSKKNQSSKLPSIVKELKSLGPIILDAELMEWDSVHKKWLPHSDLMKWTQSKNPGSDENVRLFVFDVLYWKKYGDLHNKPLSERLKVLNEVSKKFGKHLIKCPGYNIKSEKELKTLFSRLRLQEGPYHLSGRNGIDGLMGKLLHSTYPLNGRTIAWMKLKWLYELDTIILGIQEAKPGIYNYIVGYSIPTKMKDKFIPVKELNGSYYGILGKTFNTKIKGKIGQIANVGAFYFLKTEKKGKIRYSFVQPRVITIKPDKKVPDDYLEVEKLVKLKTKSFTEFFILAKPKTGQWTIEEGMTGKYGVQVHTRGISIWAEKFLTAKDYKKYGLEPQYFIPSSNDIKQLSKIYPKISEKDWKNAINKIQKPKTSAKVLEKLVNEFIKNNDISKLSKNLQHSLALLDVVSIHQDIRLVPDGTDYFEGGHWTTPGDQFKENRLLKINEHVFVQFMIKTPHVGEYSGNQKEPIIRGPSSWISVGAGKPLIVPPNSIGSTANNYACFWRYEYGTWKAGRQTSPHGKHFKLFKFKGNLFNGWYIFMWAPLGGKRVWLFYKPKHQEKYEDKKYQGIQFTKDIENVYKFIYKAIYFKK